MTKRTMAGCWCLVRKSVSAVFSGLAVRRFCFVSLFFAALASLQASEAHSFSPNEYYRGVQNILVLPVVVQNSELVFSDGVPGIPGLLTADELSELAVELITKELSDRGDVNVSGVKFNDLSLVQPATVDVVVFASFSQVPEPKPGYRSQLLALHVRVIRPVKPPYVGESYYQSFPVALEIPEDKDLFDQNVEKALLQQLQRAVTNAF